jgi:hypothetical protein
MRCNRCAGLRVQELMLDGGMRATAYRCVLCGDLVDEKILYHREGRMVPRTGRPRTPIFGKRPGRRRPVLTTT